MGKILETFKAMWVLKVGVSPFCDIFYIAKLTHFSLDFGFWVKWYL